MFSARQGIYVVLKAVLMVCVLVAECMGQAQSLQEKKAYIKQKTLGKGRAAVNAADKGVKDIIKKQQPSAFITAPVGQYTLEYLDGRRTGMVLTGQPTTSVAGTAKLWFEVLDMPLKFNAFYGNDNNPQMQPAFRWSVDLDIEQFIYKKRDAINNDIKELEDQMNTRLMHEIDSAYHSLQSVKKTVVDSLKKLKATKEAEANTYYESIKERQKDSLKLAAPEIKAWREKNFVNQPDRWVAEHPEEWARYQRLKDLRNQKNELNQRLKNPGIILTKYMSLNQFKVGTQLLTLPQNVAIGTPIDGAHIGISIWGGQVVSGAGKLRYNRVLSPFPESNAAYLQVKDLKTKIGHLNTFFVAAYDQPNAERLIMNADSLAYFMPKHNHVAGLGLETKPAKGVKLSLHGAVSHTRLLAEESLQAFAGIGQLYNGTVHWTLGKATLLADGRYVSPNFFSNTNAYMQAGLGNGTIKYIQQFKKNTQLHLDATILQVNNRRATGGAVMVGSSINQQFKKGYMLTLGVRNQETVLSHHIPNLDSANSQQRVTTLDLRGSGQLSSWLKLELHGALLSLNSNRGPATTQSLQQTYGANVRMNIKRAAEARLGFSSTYVTDAELISGPRMPSGRLYSTQIGAQTTVRRVLCTTDAILNMGQEHYRTLNAQVKLSYTFSKYISGHVRYLHQLLSGPYEQYNYMNEQVGVGVLGSL